MSTNLTILNELRELQSSLSGIERNNAYSVPHDYFSSLPAIVMQRINAAEELESLSPLLAGLSKKMDYSLPGKYFSELTPGFSENVKTGDESPSVELARLSPLLAGIGKETPYAVPGKYFEKVLIPGARKAKVISFSNRNWMRYAAAAVITAVIVSAGFLILDRNEIDPDVKPFAWVEKKLNKVSTDEINEFVQLVDVNSSAITSSTTPVEIKELIREVSPETIYDFLDETEIAEMDLEDDILN